MSTQEVHAVIPGPDLNINGAPFALALCAACRCVAHMCPNTQNANAYTEATQ